MIHGMYTVLSDTCGLRYTYLIDEKKATSLGEGDLHETIFDHFGVHAEFEPFEGEKEEEEEERRLHGEKERIEEGEAYCKVSN
jgi:hypothetical protein